MVAHKPRNTILPGGIPKLGRAAVYRKRALYKRKKNAKPSKEEPKPHFKTKIVQGQTNGKTRQVPLQKSVIILLYTPLLLCIAKSCFVITECADCWLYFLAVIYVTIFT